MKVYCLLLIFFIFSFEAYSQIDFRLNLNITNERGTKPAWNYGFGVSHRATDGIDSDLGELEMPPPPPQGLYVYFEYIMKYEEYEDVIYTNIDIKGLPEEEKFEIRHKLNIKWGSSREIHISWNNFNIPDNVDSLFIMDALNGLIIKADMKKKDSILIRNDAFTVLYIHGYYSKNPASVDENPDTKIFSYPNPVDDVLQISMNNFKSISIFNSAGIFVGEYQENNISLKYLPSGMYFYVIDNKHFGNFLKK